MPLKKIGPGQVQLVPAKKPAFGKRPPQSLTNCDDMRIVQSLLLAKPKLPFWQRKEI